MKQPGDKLTDRETGRLKESKKISILPILIPAIFIVASFLIYLPVINHYFVSDDFKVLYRVCLEHTLFIKGFFRPLSDITILLNYYLNGFDSTVFNSFNILIHGINSFLVYRVCLNIGNSFGKDK